MRWIGIDEAGYGPNLGPLVMSAVVAESPDDRRPDLWSDLSGTVCRAGGTDDRLWVDDSKRLYRQGQGFDRLEAAAMATLEAAGLGPPSTLLGLLRSLRVAVETEAELSPWLSPSADPPVPRPTSTDRVDVARRLRPLGGAPWRIVAVRSVVVGPARFNQELSMLGSKARVHFAAFARLLRWAWDLAADGQPTRVRGDKHGGRHFYYEPLLDALPDVWIDRGPEGPALSRYTLRDPTRRLVLELLPRADADDGLVALASIVSKAIREHWMTVFNAYWTARVPGLLPSAGYPADAARFRRQVEAHASEPDPPPALWWRLK